MGRPSDALTFFYTFGHPNEPIFDPVIGQRRVGLLQQTSGTKFTSPSDYARTRSNYMYFCLYIMGRLIDTVPTVFDTVGHPQSTNI